MPATSPGVAMIRASSERVVGSRRVGESLRGTLSCASLASSGLFTGTLMSRRSRCASLSPTPKSLNHGRRLKHHRLDQVGELVGRLVGTLCALCIFVFPLSCKFLECPEAWCCGSWAAHGTRSYSPRRFASRHVPTAAEELAAQSHFLDPMIIKRFDGPWVWRYVERGTSDAQNQKFAVEAVRYCLRAKSMDFNKQIQGLT